MKEAVNTPNAPEAVGAYSQGIKAGNLLFISGQIAIDPVSKYMVTNDIQQETKRVMENIGAILTAANATFNDVLKCSVYVRDMSQSKAINEVYSDFFKETTAPDPAREFVEVSKLPRNVNIEISAIAMIGSGTSKHKGQ